MLQGVLFWHSSSRTKEENYVICMSKKRKKTQQSKVEMLMYEWCVGCFVRLIFLQPVKGTIRSCFIGMTRGWKGNTERKSSTIQESGKYFLLALSIQWIIFFFYRVLAIFEIWFFFSPRGRKLNFAHDTVDCNLHLNFRAAYLSADSHCIVSGTQDMEEEIWMRILAVVSFLQ